MTPLSLGNIILLKEKGERNSQVLGRLIRSPGSPGKRKGSGIIREEETKNIFFIHSLVRII